MAFINNKGGAVTLEAIPTVGIYIPGPNVIKDEAGDPVDITGAEIKIHLADNAGAMTGYAASGYQGTCPGVTSFSCTITDAANGEFSIAVPASHFTRKWGGQMTHSLTIQYAGSSSPEGLMYGAVNVQEAF